MGRRIENEKENYWNFCCDAVDLQCNDNDFAIK